MAREVPITTAQWKLSNLSKREIWNETLRQCSAKNQLIWLWMVTYLRLLSTVRWLMSRYKLQIKMNIKITKMINRKNRCSTLLRTLRTWDMLLTCRLVVVETKTSSLDSKRIKLNKLHQLVNLLCQEVTQTDKILAIRKNWRRMDKARQLWEVGTLLNVQAWHDPHALMITDTWQVVVVHRHKQQAQPQRQALGPKSRRWQLKCAKMLWNMETVADHSI